eukprot:gene40770-49720_t
MVRLTRKIPKSHKSLGPSSLAVTPKASSSRSASSPALASSSSSRSKVEIKESLIPGAGLGLFALRPFSRGDLLCHYSGALVDEAEARYLDPTYTVSFELGRGFRLIGDYQDGDPGIYANATHPENRSLRQNARFVLQSKRTYTRSPGKSAQPQPRGRFEVRATRSIAAGEEVLVSYGDGYWQQLRRFQEGRAPVKSLAALQRDERARRRQRGR